MNYKGFLRGFLSIASFAIFVAGLYFLANIELFLAVGFGALLLIHELGHVFALKKLGMAWNGVYFIPFVGALVTTKGEFNTYNDYANLKYAGPLLGTLGVLATLLLFFFVNDPRLLYLVFAGAILNLVNVIPITLLDGHGMLRGVIKHIKWLGFLIVVVAGVFIFQEYIATLFLLIIFMLFSDSPTEEATGYQLHEVLLTSIFILVMIILAIIQGKDFVWNISYITLSFFLFGAYIKTACFNKQEQIVEITPLPLTKKERLTWAIRWLLLTIILLVAAFYSEYLLR